MARSTSEILSEINAKADAEISLNELQANTSKVAFWKAIKDIQAFEINYIEQVFDKIKAEINVQISNTEIGSKEWYVSQALAYQYGDALRVVDNQLKYPKLDIAKQIIKKCAIKETGNVGELLLKVLKDANGLLNADELNGFATYMNLIKILGTKILIRSVDADLIKLDITIQLNSQIFKADGTRIIDGVDICKNTLNDFLLNISFDGIFYLSKIEDALQTIEGVKDISINNAQYWNGTDYINMGRKYEPFSGWLKIDNTTTITYVFN